MFVYVIFRFLVILFWLLPFPVIYALSDVFAFVLCYIVGYRKKVIISNLKNSFPTWSEQKIKSLLWPIYRNISDITVETIKGFTISKRQLEKHIYATNIEVMHDLYRKHYGIIGVLGHLGNWEWAALLAGIKLKQETIALYKPLSNKYLDKYIKKSRARFGIQLASIANTARIFEDNKHKKVHFAMVADQSPSNINKAIWINFLNQETACLHGPAKYAILYSMPVVYIRIIRQRRGYYAISFEILYDKFDDIKEENIIVSYMKRLEDDIIIHPEQWLWSHRRWKHRRTS